MKKQKALFVLATDAYNQVYGPRERADISRLVNVTGPQMTRDYVHAHKDVLHDIDILFSGWEPPVLDDEFLAAAPNLKTVFYGAGAINAIMTEEAWARGITITSAIVGNSIPVAEYCLGVILFSLKHGWRFSRECREQRRFPPRPPVPGAYGSTIGLVSMGTVARELLKRLRAFDLNVVAYDPFLSKSEAAALNIQLLSLDEVFSRSDVVSVHTPMLEETTGMITGKQIAAMRHGATLINTSRGGVLRQDQLEDVLSHRPDLTAVLDVTEPEPPAADCRLFDLPNVIMTPHIAGSLDGECRRMGRMMVEELQRLVEGKPMQWVISPQMAAHSSHRPLHRSRPLAAV